MKKKAEELLDQIYDTIMGNIGLTGEHTPFPAEETTNQYIDAYQGKIYFEYKGKAYELSISEVPMEEK